jgi:DNA modification methylase
MGGNPSSILMPAVRWCGIQPSLILPTLFLTTRPITPRQAAESGAGEHTAPFPVGLPVFFLKAFSDPGDTVFEPFAGSGTTLIAAEQLGRRCYAMEISPAYCDVVLARWEKFTGKAAQRA